MGNSNNYSWNMVHKFSWGHIVAFIALIIISYIAYMGDFYQHGGHFMSSLIKIVIIDVCLLMTFIGGQMMKGVKRKFGRWIVVERVFMALCPIAFVFAMIPYNHFWSVFNQGEQINGQFIASIEKAKTLFDDYEAYATQRIRQYRNSQAFETMTSFERDAYEQTLYLQLLSKNTERLKVEAIKWIDNSNQGTTVWNAFLVGNIREIENAIRQWDNTLVDYSKHFLTNESQLQGIGTFDAEHDIVNSIVSDLQELAKCYRQNNGLNFITVITGIILFTMLLFPYFLQDRCTKAKGLYFLWPWHRSGNDDSYISQGSMEKEDTKGRSINDDIYSGTF